MDSIQMIFIHGGSTFQTREDFFSSMKKWEISLDQSSRWSSSNYLEKNLPSQIQIIRPKMPCKENAKYSEWKILFEKFVAELTKPTILVGVSLGGIFLVKWLSENSFSKKLLSVYLIAPPFDNTLPREELVGGFKLGTSFDQIKENSDSVSFLFSSDDTVVPLSHMDKFKKVLPWAKFHVFNTVKGHFSSEEFPEFIELIKEDLN